MNTSLIVEDMLGVAALVSDVRRKEYSGKLLREKYNLTCTDGEWSDFRKEVFTRPFVSKRGPQKKSSIVLEDKKVGGKMDWRQLCDHADKSIEVKRANSWSQDEVTASIDTDEPILIVPIADWHAGSYGTPHSLLQEFTDTILSIPNAYVIILGDMLQMAIKMRSVAELCDNVLPPGLQMDFLESWLDEIGHRVICSCWDNHCYREGTEALTRRGWVAFQDLTSQDELAQFDSQAKISFALPNSLQSFPFKGNICNFEIYNHRQSVTPNHDIVLKGGIKMKAGLAVRKAELVASDLILEGKFNSPGIEMSDEWIRLATWVCADGTTLLNHAKKKNFRVQFKLSKPRKIEELKALLERMEIPYTLRPSTISPSNKLQPYVFRIYSDAAKKIVEVVGLGREKKLPESFRWLSGRQLDILLDTLLKTDAMMEPGAIRWSSVSKHNVDVVQQACVQNGLRCHYRIPQISGGFESRLPIYNVSIKTGQIERKTPISMSEEEYDGTVYCATMPEGTLITRLEGKVAFSGNSVEREEKAVGFSNYARIMGRKVAYFGGIGHVNLKVGEQEYAMAVSHKFRGRSYLNPLLGQQRYLRMEAQDREICLAGDSHTPGFAMHREGDRLRLAMNAGTTQLNSTYGKRYFSIKSKPDFPVFTLHPQAHSFNPYWSLGDYLGEHS